MADGLFDKAKCMAGQIAWRAGVIITDAEEEAYAQQVMDNYDDAKPLYQQVMGVIAEDFAG